MPLPKQFIGQEKNFVPDPDGRRAHWLHQPTGTVIAMEADWSPSGSDPAAEAPGAEESSENLVGKRVEVIQSGRRGQISDTGNVSDPDDPFLYRIILDGDGHEVEVDRISEVRFLTDDEIAADEAALEASKTKGRRK